MTDYTTTKLLIQDNINQIMSKTNECDATVVDNIAFVSATLAVADSIRTLSPEEVKRQSETIKKYLELFPKRCSCKQIKKK